MVGVRTKQIQESFLGMYHFFQVYLTGLLYVLFINWALGKPACKLMQYCSLLAISVVILD